MTFWLYMITVILSLPKTLVFVVLGSPGNDKSKAAKWGKVVAIGVVVIITIFASWWIRKKMTVAIKEIEAERAAAQSPYDEELGMLGGQVQQSVSLDTSYHGAGAGYQGNAGQQSGMAGYQSGAESYQGAPLTQPYSYEGAPGRAM
jgi:type VI protein secretion system component VasK